MDLNYNNENCEFVITFQSHKLGISLRSLCHLENIKQIATACADGQILLWSYAFQQIDHDTLNVKLERELKLFNDSVLTIKADTIEDGDDHTYFFAGGKEKYIIRCNTQGDIKGKYMGHNGPVCDLQILSSNDISPLITCSGTKCQVKKLLISGSWDGTARIWNIHSYTCLFVLEKHSLAVSIIPWINGKTSEIYIYCGSQDKSLKLWSSKNNFSNEILTINNAHDDIIRSLAIIDENELVTSSNDGQIKIWDLLSLQLKKTLQAHDHFIYNISLNSLNTDILASSSEDSYLSIWNIKTMERFQHLKHSSSVFQSCFISPYHIVSICEDGTLRIWKLTLKNKYLTSSDTQTIEELSQSSCNPDISKKPTRKGQYHGEIYDVVEDDHTVQYIWLDSYWVDLRDNSNCPNQSVSKQIPHSNYYSGDGYFPPGYYDFIFKVEFNNKYKTLPFNAGQSTENVARIFCTREEISNSYISQIVEFIQQNAGMKPQSKVVDTIEKSISVNKFSHIPAKDFIYFNQFNAAKIKAHLWDIVDKPSMSPILTIEQKGNLKNLVDKLLLPDFFTEDIKLSELNCVFNSQIIDLKSKDLQYVILLWGILALHPDIELLFKDGFMGVKYIRKILNILENKDSCVYSLQLQCYIFLSNLFKHSLPQLTILNCSNQVIDALQHTPNNFSSYSCLALLNNISRAIYLTSKSKCQISTTTEILIPTTYKMLNILTEAITLSNSLQSRYHLIVILGTILSNKTLMNDLLKKYQLNDKLIGFRNVISNNFNMNDQDLENCIHEVISLLNSTI